MRREVETQAALDEALAAAKPGDVIVCTGSGEFRVDATPDEVEVWAYGSSTVRADGSSTVRAYGSSTVWAYGSSTVRADGSSTVWADGSSTVWADGSSTVWADGSSTVRADGSSTVWADGSSTVRAYGSSTVWAYGSSTVRADGSSTVWAYGSSTVRADGSSTVRADGSSTVRAADKSVAIHQHSDAATIEGGTILPAPSHEKTAAEWCAQYGAEVEDGVAILFKVVDRKFRSSWGTSYAPGTTPTAPDWDGGVQECGKGLHFCATPLDAASFAGYGGNRYVACPVRLDELAVPGHNAEYPYKVKAPRVCAPCYEVTLNGKRVGEAAVA